MIPVYCTYSAFEEIMMFSEEHPALYELLTKHSGLVLDLSQEELVQKLPQNIYLKSAYKSRGGLKTKPEFFKALTTNSLSADDGTGVIAILDCDVQKATQIRKQYGILALSKNEMEADGILPSLQYSWNWQKDDKKEYICPSRRAYNGWAALLRPVTDTIPVSVGNIIISDDYLLNTSNDDHVAETIVSIIQGVLPPTDFIKKVEVLIMAGDSKKTGVIAAVNYPRIDKIITKLNTLVAQFKPLTIKFGFLTHPIEPGKFAEFHERFLIMDYATASSHHGFLDFQKGIATQANDLNYNWAFHNLGNKVNADLPLKKIKTKLSAIKKLEAVDRTSFKSSYFKRGHTNIRLLQNLA